ncbi:MAG: helix-turn-helix domain-containing protein [Zavarzinella sp.]|nr:helix-turn-helix domain-containing protein [Zavarzinella sp.]
MRRARTPDELGFDQYDRQRLARAVARAADLRFFRRLQAVLLVARGFPVPEVARITGAKPDAVYHWLRLYLQTHEPDRLRDTPRTGRPRVAGCITDARIVREFRRDPLRLGYNTTNWTVALLAQHLGRKYACPISARTLRRRMRDLGLCWKRPRYAYADKDPHRAQKKGGLSAA